MSAKVRGTISRTIMGANGLELRFVMRSDPRYLQVVRGAVGSLAAAIGWNESDCMAITMALDEAVANVIRHAYHNSRDGEVELTCRESAEGFEAILSDRGEAPDQAKICARKPGSDTLGGLGTHIIRDVMDTVTYENSSAGNRLVLTKRFQKTI